jgi:hypothetical protein
MGRKRLAISGYRLEAQLWGLAWAARSGEVRDGHSRSKHISVDSFLPIRKPPTANRF